MMKKSFKTFLYLIATFLILAQSAYALNVVKLSPEYFPNTNKGTALSSADIFVGVPDLDPEIVANQKTLSVQQEDGTVVAVTQPISTSAGGVPQYAGSPVTLLVDGDYSLKVLDSNGVQIYYVPSTLYYTPLTTPYARYFPDYLEVDQGAAGGGNSVFDILAEVGPVTNATLYFAHNSGAATTTYTFSTNETITDNFNIIIENGAILSIDNAITLTINGPLDIEKDGEIFTGLGQVDLSSSKLKINALWFSGGDLGGKLNKAIVAGGAGFQYQHVFVPPGDYTISTPVDATELAHTQLCYSVIDFTTANISLETTGKPAFDCTGSAYITFRGGILDGHGVNTPSSGFLLAPTATRTNQLSFTFDNVSFTGDYTKATIIAIGTAPLVLKNDTRLGNTSGTVLSITRRNSQSEASEYSTIAALPQDSISLWANDHTIFTGGDTGKPVVEVEGNTNHFSLDASYLRSVGGAPYFDFDITTDSMSYIYLDNLRCECAVEPTDAITVTGANGIEMSLSGGRIPASDNIINAPDVSYFSGDIGYPRTCNFGSGRNLTLKDVSQLFLNMLSSIETVNITGAITNGIYAIGVDSAQDNFNFTGTNTDRIYYVNTRSTAEHSYAHVYLNADQVVGAGVTETIEFSTEDADIAGEFNAGTYKFTAERTGFYSVNLVLFADVTAGDVLRIYCYSDSAVDEIAYMVAERSIEVFQLSRIVYCEDGKDIYFQYRDATNASTLLGASPYVSYLNISRVY